MKRLTLLAFALITIALSSCTKDCYECTIPKSSIQPGANSNEYVKYDICDVSKKEIKSLEKQMDAECR